MILTSLLLTNFRNFSKYELDFKDSVTVLVGPNTIGKTSILEAIFYLATGKSFRAEKDNEVVRWEEEMGRIISIIQKSNVKSPAFAKAMVGRQNYISKVKSEESEKLEIIFSDTKRFLVNGVGKRMVDFAGILKAVLFRPEDLELITDSPSLRRRYLDFVLLQVDREYRRSLISYEKGLRQRNRLLEAIRDKGASRSQLIFWDQLLIKNGNYITQKRQGYIDFLNSLESKLGKYSIVYDSSRISPARLEQYAEEEEEAGATLVGPHRDDIKFQTTNTKIQINSNNQIPNNKKNSNETNIWDLSVYGSRGEQRLAVLWLKMRELEFIEKMTEERPILLLDDIFSELDHGHRKLVMEIIDKQQTIITTADKHYIEKGGEMGIVEL